MTEVSDTSQKKCQVGIGGTAGRSGSGEILQNYSEQHALTMSVTLYGKRRSVRILAATISKDTLSSLSRSPSDVSNVFWEILQRTWTLPVVVRTTAWRIVLSKTPELPGLGRWVKEQSEANASI